MRATTFRERLRRLQAVVTCRRGAGHHEWAASAWSATVGLVGVWGETPVEAIERALSMLERRKKPTGTILVARCTCGSTYTIDRWAELYLVGYQCDDDQILELRDCYNCKSTLSVEVTP